MSRPLGRSRISLFQSLIPTKTLLHRLKTRVLLAVDGPLMDRLSQRTPWADALWREAVPRFCKEEERAALTVAAYTRTGAFDAPEHLSHEFSWEIDAIRRFFPMPPATVLVGAAGAGRELLCLARRGYQAMGFDPCPAFVQACRESHVPDGVLGLVQGAYEDLPDRLSAVRNHAPYHAAILGWGSLSHLPGDRARRHALNGMKALCPHGPLLVSWLPLAPMDARQERLRRWLHPFKPSPPRRESYDRYLGYIRTFELSEIDSLARRCGYELLSSNEEGATPWAVLRPRGRTPIPSM